MQIPATQINAAGGAMAQLYDNIAAGAIASWDVTGISQAYNHLNVMVMARTDQAGTNHYGKAIFNNDSAANYAYSNIYNSSASAAAAFESLGPAFAFLGNLPGSDAPAGYLGVGQATVFGYVSTTLNKMVTFASHAQLAAGSGNLLDVFGGFMWKSTAAINRVTVTPDTGNFVAGSRLTIYGLL